MMTEQRNAPSGDVDCDTCQGLLAEYVREQLANEPVHQTYSEFAFHIETCPRCEAAYFREFRRQGLQKSLPELQQVGRRAAVATVMNQILASVHEVHLLAAGTQANWREVLLAAGRGWVDRASGAWQQVEIGLAGLVAPGSGLAPALAGLQGTEHAPEPGRALTVAPEGANFELHVGVTPAGEDECQIEAALTLYDRLGDYGGAEVTLLHGERTQRAITDSLGRVRFDGIASADLAELRLQVRLPTA
jgi:hypothetical protein